MRRAFYLSPRYLLFRPRPHPRRLPMPRSAPITTSKMSTSTSSPPPKDAKQHDQNNTHSSTDSKKDKDYVFAPTPQDAQYRHSTLSLSSLHPSDPIHQFNAWYTACTSPPSSNNNNDAPLVHQPETCVLSTAALPSGRISSRYVYLKTLTPTGHFVIYTNLSTSRKAADLLGNPRAALAFWWREQERQVRVEGRVERVQTEEAQRYFDTRARGSRVGAWASRQSEVIEGREVLEGWVEEVERRFEGQEQIPVPEGWGGIAVVPDMIEFWQGRESRLHDRFRYTREDEKGQWKLERLSP